MSLLTDLEGLLHKVEMSQICLADMIHDCKTEVEADARLEYQTKYRFMHELETCLRAWRNKIRGGRVMVETALASSGIVIDASELCDQRAAATAAQVVLDQVDYTVGNCRVNEMIGAVLSQQVIEQLRTALEEVKEWE